MRTDLRLTDLVARAHLFSAPLGPQTGAVTAPQVPGDVAAVVAGVGEAARRSVLDPLGRGGPAGRVEYPTRVLLPFLDGDDGSGAVRAPARQADETTCAAAVLTMLALAGDPRLALQVACDPVARFTVLQRRVQRACSRTGPVTWPRRYGTAPWAAAAVARYGQVRYTHRVVGRDERGEPVLRAAVAAAASGVPVPLFTGGDKAGGWQAAVPRHVVLLVDVRNDGGDASGEVVRVYEPSSATMHTLPTPVLLAPESAGERERGVLAAALGAWPHVVWAVLPR